MNSIEILFGSAEFWIATVVLVLGAGVGAMPLARACDRRPVLVWACIVSLGFAVLGVFVAGGRGFRLSPPRFDYFAACDLTVRLGATDIEALLNILLYAPFAFFLTITTRRFLAAAVTAAVIAVSMEVLQTAIDMGVCEVADVVRNLAGVVLGAALGAICLILLMKAGNGPPSD